VDGGVQNIHKLLDPILIYPLLLTPCTNEVLHHSNVYQCPRNIGGILTDSMKL